MFDKLRCLGHSDADGQTIPVEGRKYGITAHVVCTLKLVHVVMENTDGPAVGHQRAMVVLEIEKNGYIGMDGAALLIPALINGLVIEDPHRPADHSWRVLPRVELPPCFASGTDSGNPAY